MLKPLAHGAARAMDGAWRALNRGRPRVLIYTDSRGINLSNRAMAAAKQHFGSHVSRLQHRYRVDHRVCPFNYTTMIDFLAYADRVDVSQYDAIVLHCGIVDFSPRPLSSLEAMRTTKIGEPRFDAAFRANEGHYESPFADAYEGEATTNLYSQEFLATIIAELQTMPQLIWVSSNRVVSGWDGNWRPRPKNLDRVVEAYDALILTNLRYTVNLRDWDDDDVRRFTVDNVHFTRAGFAELERRIEKHIQQVLLGA